MSSMKLSIPMCAALYILKDGPKKMYELVRKYNIKRDTLYRMEHRGLVTITQQKPKIVHITDLGRQVAEKNLDTCKEAYEVLKACREEFKSRSCYKVHYAYIIVPLP